jgi:hypothetical protein
MIPKARTRESTQVRRRAGEDYRRIASDFSCIGLNSSHGCETEPPLVELFFVRANPFSWVGTPIPTHSGLARSHFLTGFSAPRISAD